MDAGTYEFHSQGICSSHSAVSLQWMEACWKPPLWRAPANLERFFFFFPPSALVGKMEASMEALQIVLLPGGVASSRSHIVRERPLTTFPSSDFSRIILDSRDFFFFSGSRWSLIRRACDGLFGMVPLGPAGHWTSFLGWFGWHLGRCRQSVPRHSGSVE